LGEMRLEMGKYLRLDAALAERIRKTPGWIVPPVGFAVVARGGLSVQSEGTGARSALGNLGHAVLSEQLGHARRNGRVGQPG
jgi:hypothetical protein